MNVVIPVGTTESVAAFYVDVLGLKRMDKGGTGAWLQAGDLREVHLSEREGQGHPDSHFAMVVGDLDALLKRLDNWTWQTPLRGARRGFTRDPAGNRIELIEDQESPADAAKDSVA